MNECKSYQTFRFSEQMLAKIRVHNFGLSSYIVRLFKFYIGLLQYALFKAYLLKFKDNYNTLS